MPAALTYPGVYVEEIPSGVRTITPVSTSVTAFVGFTSRGPTNRARQIFNPGDFEREDVGIASKRRCELHRKQRAIGAFTRVVRRSKRSEVVVTDHVRRR